MKVENVRDEMKKPTARLAFIATAGKMAASDVVEPAKSDMLRLEALLKAMRNAAFEMMERKNQKDILQPEDFACLFDIAIDRLDLINNHVDEIESTLKSLEGVMEENAKTKGAAR